MQPAKVSYQRELEGFLAQKGLDDASRAVDVFHAVRNLAYGRRGGREPAAVIAHNEGSCSGKHTLLRDALRHLKQTATVETVKGDFAAAIPSHPTMSPALQEFCEEGGITDFHQYVVWESPKGEIKLDATWPDELIEKGLPGNRDWDGQGDTVLALKPEATLDRAENIAEYKSRLLGGLTQTQRARRERFLDLLTEWVATTKCEGAVL